MKQKLSDILARCHISQRNIGYWDIRAIMIGMHNRMLENPGQYSGPAHYLITNTMQSHYKMGVTARDDRDDEHVTWRAVEASIRQVVKKMANNRSTYPEEDQDFIQTIFFKYNDTITPRSFLSDLWLYCMSDGVDVDFYN